MPRGVYKRSTPPWNKGLTKETDDRIKNAEETKKQTNLKKYGVENVFQSKEVLDKLSDDRHSGELARRSQATKEVRYGDKNYNNMEKNKDTKLKRYGNGNYNNPDKNKETRVSHTGAYWSDDQRSDLGKIRILKDSSAKAVKTIISKYGSVEDYYKMITKKIYDTKRKNGTLSNFETKPEKEMYKDLCDKYGEDDVVKQYYDEARYPFKCDFYIKSEDKFIELHKFFTHGPHPFNADDPDDIALLNKLKEDANNGNKWAKNIIYTWTNLDVRKLETAKKNHLNFEAIY